MERTTIVTVYETVFSHIKQLPGNISGVLFVVNLDDQLITSKCFGDFDKLPIHSLPYSVVQKAIALGEPCSIEKTSLEQSKYSAYGVPLYDASNLVAGLGLLVDSKNENKCLLEFLQMLTIAISIGYEKYHREMFNLEQSQGMTDEVHRRDKLFAIASKFHSTMNAEQVVYNILDSIQDLYPDVEVDLYLSLDVETSNPTYHVKSLNMEGTDDLTLLAFRDGISKIQSCENNCCIASPIRGNQGVYGVLRMERKGVLGFNKREQEYIQFITDAGGSAFENAVLYEQSRNLIQELRMINEMARQMNRSLRLQDVLDYILSQIKAAFHADYSLILTFDTKKNVYRVISSFDPEYVDLELSSEKGYLGKLYRSKESYIVSDNGGSDETGNDEPLGIFPHRSLLLVPFIQNGEITGAIAVMDKRKGHFNYDNLKFLHLIAQHTSLAITNATLHLEMERLIITDTLTGLNTRKHLNEKTIESMQQDEFGSMILIDIDHFKIINDRYGHLVGDEILVQVAQVLKESIRKGDVASRWGGEEMAVYLPMVTHESALRIAERIRSQVYEKTDPRITVSIGVSSWSQEDGDVSPQKLFLEADQALYFSKNNGRNQVASFHIVQSN